MVKLENPETRFSLRRSSNGRHFRFIFALFLIQLSVSKTAFKNEAKRLYMVPIRPQLEPKRPHGFVFALTRAKTVPFLKKDKFGFVDNK